MSALAVRAAGLTVCYGGLTANADVTLSVPEGEIHALVGENGAGKSTLMSAIAGLVTPSAGTLELFGSRVTRFAPPAAVAAGVGLVHQHVMLVPSLSVADNVVLGAEPTRGPLLDRSFARMRTHELSVAVGVPLDPDRRASDLSLGERQALEIVKVLHRGARLLLLDEPTAVLTPPEVERFFEVVLRLRASGRTIVIVTHRLDEVLAIASACTVLRRGRTVHSGPITGHTIQSLGRLVVGPTALPDVQRPPEPAPGEAVVLSVADLEVARGRGPLALAGVSLSVRRGEILGLAGVEGNGQDVLVEAIAGLVRPRKGTIALGGRDLTRLSVRERLRAGVAHIPEDRRDRGVVLGLSIGDNLVLGREGDFARHGVVRQAEIDRFGHERVRALDVRPPEPSALVGALSGGNQQKVVVGRELGRRPQLLLAAQPTRGVDLGASARIHAALTAFAAAGGAVLLLSADLGELLALSHRVVVFRRGRVVAERRPAETTARDLGAIMVGAEPTGGVR